MEKVGRAPGVPPLFQRVSRAGLPGDASPRGTLVLRCVGPQLPPDPRCGFVGRSLAAPRETRRLLQVAGAQVLGSQRADGRARSLLHAPQPASRLQVTPICLWLRLLVNNFLCLQIMADAELYTAHRACPPPKGGFAGWTGWLCWLDGAALG